MAALYHTCFPPEAGICALNCDRSGSGSGGNVCQAGGSPGNLGDGDKTRAAGAAAGVIGADAAGSTTTGVASGAATAARGAAGGGSSSAPATAACDGDAKLLPIETSAPAAIARCSDEAAAFQGPELPL